MVNLDKFSLYDYLERERTQKRVSIKEISAFLNLTEANWCNKRAREKFSGEEIFKMAYYLDLDLNHLKERLGFKDEDVFSALEEISYIGYNNFDIQQQGFSKIQRFLNNKLMLEELDERVLVKFGYFVAKTLPAGKDSNGLHATRQYLENIIKNNIKIDLRFLAGLIGGLFFSKNYSYINPYYYSKETLVYFFTTYNEDEICNVLNILIERLDEYTKISIDKRRGIWENIGYENEYDIEDKAGKLIDILICYGKMANSKKVNCKMEIIGVNLKYKCKNI
ncbi:hypothetical protein AN396_08890 [Candidatus Epulonipiscium fishelsonii]|uniref:Uncharacterized protein n=1 Tax=Candidatus Epulonipiscium fishelsonii TaxID=77094 RepID=A0ACC8XAH9_9FIRM|nr:hypothetical protein AN396_08890 [Epulopiscium sp. SCG-B11WGA-EpuloA1]